MVIVTIAFHRMSAEVPKETLNSILKQAQLNSSFEQITPFFSLKSDVF